MSNNQSKSSQPVLPGFYFDADRGKYFRIQPNHIAPQDAKYSRQAVTAERNLKSQQRHDADRARGGRVKTAARKRPKLTSPTSSTQPAAVLPRSSYLDSSCAGAVLRRRLGAVRQQQQSSLAIVKHEWARRVEGRTVFHNNLMSDTFAVDRENGGGQLFTLCVPPPPTVTAARQQSGPALCVTRPRISSARTAVAAMMNTTITTTTTTTNNNPNSIKSAAALQTDYDSPPPARTMYPHNLTTFIDECRGRLHRIDVVNNTGGNAIFWLTHQIGPTSVPEHVRHSALTSTLRFSRRNYSDGNGNGPGSWTSMRLVGTTADHSGPHSAGEVLDIKSNDDGTMLAFTNSSVLMVCDIERFIQQGGGGARSSDMTMGRVGDELHGKKHERMCVEWKGPNVVMTGDRAGRILLSDVRVPAAAVVRARCPWAVSALRSVGGQHHAPPNNDNNNNNNNIININTNNNNDGLLVWGLEGGRLFDLRFCKDLDEKQNRRGGGGGGGGGGNGHRRTTTRPTIIFDVPPGRRQMRYGMAFDYDAHLGIVASASTDFYKTHRMALWDVSSGKMLMEPESSSSSSSSRLSSSPLVNHRFPQPVTCAQFVDLEHRGGIKTLLTASGKDIVAWDM